MWDARRAWVIVGCGSFILTASAVAASPAAKPVRARRCKTVRLKVGAEPLGYRARGKVCDGQREGVWRFTFLDGRPRRQGAYQAGQETGRWRMWYRRPRGRRRAEGDYRDGQRTGSWTRWHRNRRRSLSGTYRGGLRHGRWRRWHRNGRLYEDRWYVDGRREGKHWRWDRRGRATLVRACAGDACEVLCRARRRRWCAPTEHPAVEQTMPAPTTPAKRVVP